MSNECMSLPPLGDLISRSALLNELIADYAYAAADIVKAAPAVDAAPVVRCRECKWFKPYQKPVEDFDGRCVVHMCETDEEEYCSLGGRKDNETD